MKKMLLAVFIITAGICLVQAEEVKSKKEAKKQAVDDTQGYKSGDKGKIENGEITNDKVE